MKKCSVLKYMLAILVLVCIFPSAAYANSSWRWISETRPYDVLPVVIAVTLAVETAGIKYLAKVKNVPKIFFAVTAANLVSFAVPYLFAMCSPIYTFQQNLEHTPMYNVGIFYLTSTLIAECPMVHHVLQNDAEDSRQLLKTVFVLNVLTTIFTAAVERIFCQGTW